MILKTNYKDDILASGTTVRKYTQITNSDGTVSFVDATEYQQEGDTFGANDINSTNAEVNRSKDTKPVTLLANSWVGDDAPYSQTVAVEGLLATDNPLIVSQLEDGASKDTARAYNKAFAIVASGTGISKNGSATFKVYKKPQIDITIGLKGV